MDDKPYNRIVGRDFIETVCPVIGVDPGHVSRIVIDASFGDAVRVYVETFATEGLLKVDWPSMLKDADIHFADKPEGFTLGKSTLPARLGGEETEDKPKPEEK